MPIYEYQCKKCGKEMETIARFNDPNPTCSNCGHTMEKKISLSSFHLKGNGWYVTDYKEGGDKANKPDLTTQASKSNESSSIPTDL